jgi:hypothetical protein
LARKFFGKYVFRAVKSSISTFVLGALVAGIIAMAVIGTSNLRPGLNEQVSMEFES